MIEQKENKKIGIVILNYLAYQDTIACVNSIKNQSFQDYEVVIVDNGSSNNSFELLRKAFASDDNLHVISPSVNIGFAKGNNFGIAFLKKLGIFNILVINGDTLLNQVDYLERLANFSSNENVAMIGTRILTRDGYNQNIVTRGLRHLADIKQSEKVNKRLRLMITFHLFEITRRFYRILNIKKATNTSNRESPTIKILDSNQEMLHGACIFFTEYYLKHYIGFYPETFLYQEEEFLALICQRLNIKQVYLSDLEIYHKEDASSNMATNYNTKKSLLSKIEFSLDNLFIMSEALEMSPETLEERIKG